jgi:dTDP-3-amino-2,3,6-trideoxy-4-keto-D-glucose/dTDP-3-amino-3,4,6-trideoxy-alpha-D-glucose/dTDP-2,6-dideoxy-D-kanosamine transaminase
LRQVPIFSPSESNAGPLIQAAVLRVLSSQRFVMSAELAAFEKEFASYVGVDHCIGVANGTDALELALRAIGVTSGSTVVCAANAGFYSSTAIHAVGATPIYADVDDATLTVSPSTIAKVLDSEPAAVIVTHLYGQLADIEQLTALCHTRGIPIVEDCAQSHGARRNNRMAGSFSEVSCFSFYPTKNLGALGDGGAVATKSGELANTLRALRQYGWRTKYDVGLKNGRNSRLDELQAAVLRVKLAVLDKQNDQRRHIAERYNSSFAALPLKLPCSVAADFVAHLYVVRTNRRLALRNHLNELGISTEVHYPIPDHRQFAYESVSGSSSLPITELACETVLSFPCYPGMAEDDVTYVIDGVTSFFSRQGA